MQTMLNKLRAQYKGSLSLSILSEVMCFNSHTNPPPLFYDGAQLPDSFKYLGRPQHGL